MARNWTPEERAKQAAAIRRWKPWKNATGPKTPEGRAVCKNNGYVHGYRSEDMNEINRLLAEMRCARRAILNRQGGPNMLD